MAKSFTSRVSEKTRTEGSVRLAVSDAAHACDCVGDTTFRDKCADCQKPVLRRTVHLVYRPIPIVKESDSCLVIEFRNHEFQVGEQLCVANGIVRAISDDAN